MSSSGHLEIGKRILGDGADVGGLTFDIVVHVATVLATLVVLHKEVFWIFKGLFKPLQHRDGAFVSKLNDEQRYALNILISMIPVGIVGLFFKDNIEALYADNVLPIVGGCLLLTACLLALTHFYRPQPKRELSPLHAFIIGVAQACAVLPGLSRSGSTIATGLLLGNNRQSLAPFSFLIDRKSTRLNSSHITNTYKKHGQVCQWCSYRNKQKHGMQEPIGLIPLAIGFAAAFVSGCFACKWMIAFVKKCRLIYFAVYCAVAGLVTLFLL